MAGLHLRGLLRRLAENEVTYVIVGGVGVQLQGSPNITGDLDIVQDPTPDNLARLATAISGPATRKKPIDSTAYVPHPHVAGDEFFTEYMAMYETSDGAIDVLIELPGVGPYDLLVRDARCYELRDAHLKIRVASLTHIIRSVDHGSPWRVVSHPSHEVTRAGSSRVGNFVNVQNLYCIRPSHTG